MIWGEELEKDPVADDRWGWVLKWGIAGRLKNKDQKQGHTQEIEKGANTKYRPARTRKGVKTRKFQNEQTETRKKIPLETRDVLDLRTEPIADHNESSMDI